MTDLWQEIQGKLKELAGGWAGFITLGSFILYVLGYLSIRFHLTTLGIGTDLAVLDERYIFAGAKFLVYLFATFPIIVMFALVLALIAAAINGVYSLIQKKKKESPSFPKWLKWFSTPNKAAILGIVVSVLLIQIVMRKCFLFSNVLLEGLPDTGLGLEQLLLDANDAKRSLFFVGLVAGTTACAALWLYVRRLDTSHFFSKFLMMLLGFLVIVQFLFLPINYGVFIMDKAIPRVSDLGDQVSLAPNQKAWLIWEGSSGLTYLVHETACQTSPQAEASLQYSATPPAAASSAQSVTPGSPLPSATDRSSPAALNVNADTKNAVSPATSPTPPSDSAEKSRKSATPCPTPSINSSASSTENGTSGAMSGTTKINRKLVTLQQKDLKRTEILGYDRLSTLSFVK